MDLARGVLNLNTYRGGMSLLSIKTWKRQPTDHICELRKLILAESK